MLPDRPIGTVRSRIRLVVDRRGRIEVGSTPIPTADPAPVRLALAVEEPVDPADVFLFHKTTVRAPYEAARARHPDAADVLLTNTAGRITESTIANVAVLLDATWWTPPIEDGLLAGIGRAVALEDGRIRERSITVEELREAREVALVSDNRGWRPAVVLPDG